MKVLFISPGREDYLSDMVLHGLYNLFGADLTHTDPYPNMYQEFNTKESLLKLYGRGFTIWGTLPKYLNDNSDIESKIKNKYFDYIVYSIRRTSDYIELVRSYYPNNRIALIDGEDDRIVNNKTVVPSIYYPHYTGGANIEGIPYFKRELTHKTSNVFPISFSIPKEKILKDKTSVNKKDIVANYVPCAGDSYIFVDEADYYRMYQNSYYGLTRCKGGWDCMRHYEILANYCMPKFADLENCPETTMTNFPKKEIIEATNVLFNNFKAERYYELLDYVFEYTKQHLTTEVTATYIINKLLSLN